MKELTPEQQGIVEKAAKYLSRHHNFAQDRMNIEDSFKAGVNFCLSSPSLYMGLLELFAGWIRTFEALDRQNGQWVIESQLSDKDIVKAFIEDIKQKENGNEANKT